MQVSHKSIINKIEVKIRETKETHSEAKIREHLQAIKTLCELILDDSSLTEEVQASYPKPVQKYDAIAVPPTIQSVSTLSERKIEMEDGSNGDSIFDF